MNPAAFSSTPEVSSHAENKIKLAFIYNFLKFIKWPQIAEKSSQSNFLICVLGENPFGSDIESLQRVQAQGKGIRFRILPKLENYQSCQVIYITLAIKAPLIQILKTLEGQPILTVGDEPKFNQAGGIIRFFVNEDMIRFEINNDAARKSNLVISSHLLRLSKHTDEDS